MDVLQSDDELSDILLRTRRGWLSFGGIFSRHVDEFERQAIVF